MELTESGNGNWDLAEQETVFRTPIFDILSGPVHCGRSGCSHDFFKFAFPDWVNVIAVTETDELIMIKQHRYGTNRVELEIPGGGIGRNDEAPVDAGRRELAEETGYAGETGRVIGKVCPNPALQDNLCYTILVEKVELKNEPRFDDMEDIETLKVPLTELDSMIRDGIITHGLVLNALHFFDLYRNRQ